MLGLRIGIKEGALLMWTLPHFIDLMIAFMLGRKLVEISANCNVRDLGETERMLDFDPIVTGAEVVFENGVSASFCESSDYSFDILCEEGEISASQGGPNQPPYISVRKLGEAPTRTIVEGQRSGIERALDELEEAVCSRPNCLAGLDELKLQQLILSGIAYSGLCGGAVVEIGQIPNDLVITGNSGGFVA
jgi:predicted dehydrogenase